MEKLSVTLTKDQHGKAQALSQILNNYGFVWSNNEPVTDESLMKIPTMFRGDKTVYIVINPETQLISWLNSQDYKVCNLSRLNHLLTMWLEPESEPDSHLIDKQSHYTANGIEPIEIMIKNFTREQYQGFLKGNVLKYLMRYERKNGYEDIQKALTYMTWLEEDVKERGC